MTSPTSSSSSVLLIPNLTYPRQLSLNLLYETETLIASDIKNWKIGSTDSVSDFKTYSYEGYVRGQGIIRAPLHECIEIMFRQANETCFLWDRTLREFNVLKKWPEESPKDKASTDDCLVQYVFHPGFPLCLRDMVYLLFERKINDNAIWLIAGSHADICNEKIVTRPSATSVRSMLKLHAQCLQVLPDGNCFYDCLQKVDIGGWVPNFLTIGGMQKSLLREFVCCKKLCEKQPPCIDTR